jgi:catalase-peroxidase
VSADESPIDEARLLRLTVPQMTVFLGALRALGADHGESRHGVCTYRLETLSNDSIMDVPDVSIERPPR